MSIMRQGTALLVIDVQSGLFREKAPIFKADQLLKNIMLLIDNARVKRIPVIFVQHANRVLLVEGTDNWKLHHLLQPLEGDIRIRKNHASAFKETNLKAELEERHIRKLIAVGLTSHGCVKATCQDAKKEGYEVILVKDAHSNFHPEAGRLIEEWNEKLSRGTVTLKSTSEVVSESTDENR